MTVVVALALGLLAQPAADAVAKPPAKPTAKDAASEVEDKEQTPAVTGKEYNAEKTQLETLMRQKGLLLADLPKALRDQTAKVTAAVQVGNFEAAVRELRLLAGWANQTVVDAKFVRLKLGRLSKNARWYLHRGTLSDEQSQGIYRRLDSITEAMSAERFGDANGVLNDLLEYLKTLPQPDTAPPPEE
jgi:hypothetical protein